MKFNCLQENLLKALTKVYRAVPTKSELPILANVLISAKDNQLKLSATNLSTTITTYIGANVDEEGAITIPAKLLRDFVNNLGEGVIEISVKNDVMSIKAEAAKSKMHGVSAQDYPDLPEKANSEPGLKLNPGILNEVVNSVAFSAAIDDSRPIFTGVFIKFEDGVLTAAASDGFRLSEIKVELPDQEITYMEAVIPSKTLLDITRVFSDTEGDVNIYLDDNENLAIFEQGDTLIATRIIDGDYPDYTRIIPDGGSTTAHFDTAALLEAAKLSDIFAKEAESALILKITPTGKIELNVTAQEMGDHKGTINAEVTAEEEIEIGINSKFLIDFLNNAKHEKLIIKTNGKTNPCLFVPSDEKRHLHIIMPMQINN